MRESYLTVRERAFAVYTEKRSEFICNIKRAETREEALGFISEIKKKYPDARHNVYAYIVRNENTSGYSDDGEPSGTGGTPLLDMLRKKGLTDVSAVVTRYFGGILLGTGGLIRAYTTAGSMAVENAGIVRFTECEKLEITLSYADVKPVVSAVERYSGRVLSSDYAECVTVTAAVPAQELEMLLKDVADLSSGRAKTVYKGKMFAEK